MKKLLFPFLNETFFYDKSSFILILNVKEHCSILLLFYYYRILEFMVK